MYKTILFILLTVCLTSAVSNAQDADMYRTIVFGCYSNDIDEFEAFARKAKAAGATHIVITAEDLPWANWQFDTPGDPYPAWAVSNVGFLKIAVPVALRDYLPKDYAGRVMQMLQQRCRILRELGLKAAFTTFEPQMLPEQIFRDHPRWRGPQVDQPFRSRVPRFAPDIDNPEVLALYRESIRILLTACPEIELISLHTNDSGAGVSWSSGLYPGPNGNTYTESRKMYQRYYDLFQAMKSGARDSGVNSLEINIEKVREENPELLVTRLEPGMALSNMEGPDATRFQETVGFLLDYFYPYYPVQGIPFPMRFLEELERAHGKSTPRLFVLLGDRYNKELYFRIYESFRNTPTSGLLSRLQLLERLAAEEVGEEHSTALLEVWETLYRLQSDIKLLNRGGTILYIGSVQQRWLTRPFVPFPEELTPAEQAYYRPHLFQALSESRARDLNEMQGTHWTGQGGGRPIQDPLLNRMRTMARSARNTFERITGDLSGEKQARYSLLATQLQVLEILIRNCQNALDYQHYLDIIKVWNLKRPHEVLESLNQMPEWKAIRQIARREIDNSALLIEILESGQGTVLDIMSTKEEENIRRFGPDIVEQLRSKINIMMDHWEDYERLFIEEMEMLPDGAEQ